MPATQKRLFIGALIFGLTTTAIAEVYTWRDENGVLHYGDKPGSDNAELVEIQTSRTNRSQVAERYAAARESRAATSNDYQEAQASAAAAEEAAGVSAQEKAAACTKARETLSNYINARRLYKTDDNGNREYLDSKAIDAARTTAEKNVADKCR